MSSCQVLPDSLVPDNSEDERWLSFAVVGDVMVHDPQLKTSYYNECNCYNFKPVFAEVAPYLKEADLTVGNLETTMPGDPEKYSGYPQFGAPDELVEALSDSGFDILTTANNHSCDKGKAAIIRTTGVVEKNHIKRLGTYRSAEDYRDNRILVIQKNGLRLAFLNYTYGTNGISVPRGVFVNLIDKDLIRSDIELARSMRPDGIIVIYHFGTEYLRFPDDFQKEMVDFAFNEGVDIVLGGHPHVLQPFGIKRTTDKYGDTRDRLVIYSLGNFLSNQRRRYKDGGVIFRFQIARAERGEGLKFKDVDYVPVWVDVAADSKGLMRHRILPVENYLDEETAPVKLTKKSRLEMMTFYADTTEHLAPSLKGVEVLAKR